MKLDHDNVRELLLQLESNLPINSMLKLNQSNTDEKTLYSALKLLEAGFLDGEYLPYIGGDFLIIIKSITWSGHEFLDNIRSEEGWKKTKTIIKNIGGASISLVSDFSAKVTAELISKQLGI